MAAHDSSRHVLPPSLPDSIPTAATGQIVPAYEAPAGLPGMAAAVGVLCITVGCLSILLSGYISMQALGAMIVSAISRDFTEAFSPKDSLTLPTGSAAAQLSTAQIQGAIDEIRKRSENKLSPIQAGALKAALGDPNQALADPATAATMVAKVVNLPDGEIWIVFTGKAVSVSADGTVRGHAPGINIPRFGPSLSICLTVIGEALASIATAILIIIFGAKVLKGRMRNGRLLQIYACIKIPLALFAGYFYYLMLHRMLPEGMLVDAPPIATIYGSVVAALGLAFPICVLVLLKTKEGQDYFRATPNRTANISPTAA